MKMNSSTLKAWLLDNYTYDDLMNIYDFGVDDGFAGLMTFDDTRLLYDRYNKEIWEIINEDCKRKQIKNVYRLLDGYKKVDVINDEQFNMLLVWYAVEHIVSRIIKINLTSYGNAIMLINK
jgi:hypothetical protein